MSVGPDWTWCHLVFIFVLDLIFPEENVLCFFLLPPKSQHIWSLFITVQLLDIMYYEFFKNVELYLIILCNIFLYEKLGILEPRN
jgi:hypothetical protein